MTEKRTDMATMPKNYVVVEVDAVDTVRLRRALHECGVPEADIVLNEAGGHCARPSDYAIVRIIFQAIMERARAMHRAEVFAKAAIERGDE